jgi:hypothetical protein
MTQLIDQKTYTLSGVTINPDATREEWMAIHKDILTCKHAASKWLAQSRDYATKRWGAEFMADTELQLELDLGLALPAEKPTLNPTDKTTAIVTIEGLSQKFQLWERKMSDDIGKWDKARLERALELLTPMEATAARIRGLLA